MDGGERRISTPAIRRTPQKLLVWPNLLVAVTPWNSWDVSPTAILSTEGMQNVHIKWSSFNQ